jgi:hypothetical protein
MQPAVLPGQLDYHHPDVGCVSEHEGDGGSDYPELPAERGEADEED